MVSGPGSSSPPTSRSAGSRSDPPEARAVAVLLRTHPRPPLPLGSLLYAPIAPRGPPGCANTGACRGHKTYPLLRPQTGRYPPVSGATGQRRVLRRSARASSGPAGSPLSTKRSLRERDDRPRSAKRGGAKGHPACAIRANFGPARGPWCLPTHRPPPAARDDGPVRGANRNAPGPAEGGRRRAIVVPRQRGEAGQRVRETERDTEEARGLLAGLMGRIAELCMGARSSTKTPPSSRRLTRGRPSMNRAGRSCVGGVLSSSFPLHHPDRAPPLPPRSGGTCGGRVRGSGLGRARGGREPGVLA